MSVTCTVRRISRRSAGPPSPSEWASIICTGVSIVAVFVTGSARRADAGQPEDARGLPAWTPRRQVRALAGGSLSVWRRLDSALCRWSGVPWPSPFVTALGWRLGQRREKWFTELAEGVEKLRERADGFDLEKLAGSDLFVDAVVTTTRTIEHTRQAEKIDALRNAVLNSVAAGASRRGHSGHLPEPGRPLHALTSAAPDAVERSPAWFASHGLTPPEAGMAGSRTQTVEAGLAEMKGRKDFCPLIASELGSAGMLTASLSGNVSAASLMDLLTTDSGRRFVRFISAPGSE